MNVASISATSGQAPDATQLASVRSRPLTGAALRNASEAVQRAEVATQFEAILLRQLLAPTMSSMLGSESGAVGGVYGDLLTNTFAQELSRGGGFGMATLIERQLTPRGAPAPVPSPSDLR